MIQIAAYRGKSWVSNTIKLLTYSCYSHIGLLFTQDMEVHTPTGAVHLIQTGNVIEAWKGGVKLSETLGTRHERGTVVDLFKLKTPMTLSQAGKIGSFLVAQLGKPYDYINVARFVPVVRLAIPSPAPSIWTRSHVFCSELAVEAFGDAGIQLLERCSAWEIPPRDPPRSPLLMHDRTITTT